MSIIKITWFFLVLIFNCANTNDKIVIPEITISKTDLDLSRSKGIQLYKNVPFSGTIENHYPDGKVKTIATFFQGKRTGWHTEWYVNGLPAAERFFDNNRKEGTHKGWWANGLQKFEFNYQNGIYQGNVKEWYETGQAFRNANFTKGYEDGTQQMWKSDGSIQANYVVKKGRRYGLLGKKLCK